MKEKTLAREILIRGCGLHTAKEVTMVLKPAPVRSGIVFERTDSDTVTRIQASAENVKFTNRCTALGNGEIKIYTVEHILAAIRGMDVDNVIIQVDSEETPMADGGAGSFCDIISDAGIITQDAERRVYSLTKPVLVEGPEDSCIIALPWNGFKCSYSFISNHPVVGNQYCEFEINPEVFKEEISKARTLVFEETIESIQKKGLGLGGNKETVLVIGEEKMLTTLKYPNEIVRHKLLDLVGDMALLGYFNAWIMGIKSGHALNNRLARKLERVLKKNETE